EVVMYTATSLSDRLNRRHDTAGGVTDSSYQRRVIAARRGFAPARPGGTRPAAAADHGCVSRANGVTAGQSRMTAREQKTPTLVGMYQGLPRSRCYRSMAMLMALVVAGTQLLTGCALLGEAFVVVNVGYQSKTINTVNAGTLLRDRGDFENALRALSATNGK